MKSIKKDTGNFQIKLFQFYGPNGMEIHIEIGQGGLQDHLKVLLHEIPKNGSPIAGGVDIGGILRDS